MEACINEVKEGKTNVCITLVENDAGFPLPRDLSSKTLNSLENGKGINAYVDFSKQRIVWGIISKVEIVIEFISERIQQEIITELSKKFELGLNKLNFLNSNLEDIKTKISISQDKLSQTRANLESFKSSSVSTIDSIIFNLNSINVSPINGTIPQITSAIASLYYLKSQLNSTILDSTQLDSTQNGIIQIQQNLNLISEKIFSSQNEISSLKDSFSKNANINVDKFVEPVPIHYYSMEKAINNNGIQEGAIVSKSLAEDLNLADYLLPSILSFFIVFTSTTLGSTLVIKERSSNAYIRNYLSNTHKTHFVIGNLLYLILLITAQITIILIFSKYTINSSVLDKFGALTVYLILGISIFSTLGMCIGYIFNSRDSAVLIAVCLSIIFIIFSPLINPIETMPPILKEIFSKSPAVITENGISKAILFNRGINDFFPIFQLFIIFLIELSICLMLHSSSKERLVKE